MKIKLPILDLSKDFKSNAKSYAVTKQIEKVNEEFEEYKCEKIGTDTACDEWFDMIQTLVHLGKIEFTPEQIQATATRHYAKLQSRDRAIIGTINISVEVD